MNYAFFTIGGSTIYVFIRIKATSVACTNGRAFERVRSVVRSPIGSSQILINCHLLLPWLAFTI